MTTYPDPIPGSDIDQAMDAAHAARTASDASDLIRRLDLFVNVVAAYQAWVTGPATVRTAANAVHVATVRLLADYGDDVLAYADHGDTIRAARRVRNIAAMIHEAEVAGTPRRSPHTTVSPSHADALLAAAGL